MQTVFERLRRITPVPFEVYMELVLYDAEVGYFSGDCLRSVPSGDFLTSPEVSPLFGETLARFVNTEAVRIGLSRPAVVDVGGGSGSLMEPLLSVSGDRVDPWAVEVSPPAREALAAVVGASRVTPDLESLPERIGGVIVANELLDNLPMALARRRSGDWRELWVGEESGELGWIERPVRPEVGEWLDRFSGPVPEGGMVEVQTAGLPVGRGCSRSLG